MGVGQTCFRSVSGNRAALSIGHGINEALNSRFQQAEFLFNGILSIPSARLALQLFTPLSFPSHGI